MGLCVRNAHITVYGITTWSWVNLVKTEMVTPIFKLGRMPSWKMMPLKRCCSQRRSECPSYLIYSGCSPSKPPTLTTLQSIHGIPGFLKSEGCVKPWSLKPMSRRGGQIQLCFTVYFMFGSCWSMRQVGHCSAFLHNLELITCSQI